VEYVLTGSNVAAPSIRLNYVKEDGERETPFSENMESAAMACLAEAERRKTSRFLGGEAENLRILCKLYYPVWAIPWKDRCLLVDGMGIVSGSFIHQVLPDVENFTEQLRRSTKVEELFRSVLRSHGETFAKFPSQTQASIAGFIDDRELLSDMMEFIEDKPKTVDASAANVAHPTLARISRAKAVEIKEEIETYHDDIKSEVAGLHFAKQTLNAETKMHEEKLQRELKLIQERHSARISEIQEEAEKRIKELDEELMEKIDEIDAIHKQEERKRLDEKRRQEKALLGLEQNKSEYEKRKEARMQKGDTVGAARWDVRLRNTQNQVNALKKRIRAISNSIKKSEKATRKTKKDIDRTHRKATDKERKRVIEAENLRNSEVEKKEGEIKELNHESLSIISKIEDLAKQKEEHSSKIKETTVSWHPKTTTLIRVPYYLAKYVAGENPRYFLHPPARVEAHKGLMTRIRKAFKSRSLKSRIGMLMKPRSKSLERLFETLEKTVNEDAKIQDHIDTLAKSCNMLSSPTFKEGVLKGLQELEVEGWIKPEEKLMLTKSYWAD
jgi:hypothetical protein